MSRLSLGCYFCILRITMKRVQTTEKETTMDLCVVRMLTMLVVLQVATTSEIFCSHEFAAAVIRACTRSLGTRSLDTDATVHGNTLQPYYVFRVDFRSIVCGGTLLQTTNDKPRLYATVIDELKGIAVRGVSRNMDWGGVKGWDLISSPPPSRPLPLSLPVPSHPLPRLSPSSPLPLEVGPLNPARGSGERCKLPQRSRN